MEYYAPVQKTYLATNTLVTDFPNDFRNSKNPKWVVFQNCRCVYMNDHMNEYITNDIRVHADWVERDRYLDSFVGFANTVHTKYKPWEVQHSKTNFKIWFTDMKGNKILTNEDYEWAVYDPHGQIVANTDPHITNFLLELLLIY
jgi:hypothetical protein